MAAAPVKEPFDSPDWIFEAKLDGYRAITVIDSTGKLGSGLATTYRWNRSFQLLRKQSMN